MTSGRVATSVAALAADRLLGEPPKAVHPTVLMGRFISSARGSRRPASGGHCRSSGSAIP